MLIFDRFRLWLHSLFHHKCASCGELTHKHGQFCRHCGAGNPDLDHICSAPGCGNLVAWSSKYCCHCGAPLATQLRGQIHSDVWRRMPGVFAHRLSIATPSKRLRNGVQVDEGMRGCFVIDGQVRDGPGEELAPSHHPASTFVHRFFNLAPNQLVNALIVYAQPVAVRYPARPGVEFQTRDALTATASLDLKVRVTNLGRFYAAYFHEGADHVLEGQLTQKFESTIKSILSDLTKDHNARDLSPSAELAATARQRLLQRLPPALEECGLSLTECGCPVFTGPDLETLRIREARALHGGRPQPRAARPQMSIDVEKLLEECQPWVGAIMQKREGQPASHLGTAFAVHGERQLVTNAHIFVGSTEDDIPISTEEEELLAQVYVTFPDGRTLRVRKWEAHPEFRVLTREEVARGDVRSSHDLAVIDVEGDLPGGLLLATKAHAHALKSGRPVVAIGYPTENLPTGMAAQGNPQPTPSSGIVKKLVSWALKPPGTLDEARVIVHDLEMTGGSSGSPVIDTSGHVVGVESSFTGHLVISAGSHEFVRTPSAVGVNFAQRIDTLLVWRGWAGDDAVCHQADCEAADEPLPLGELKVYAPQQVTMNEPVALDLEFTGTHGVVIERVHFKVSLNSQSTFEADASRDGSTTQEASGRIEFPCAGHHHVDIVAEVHMRALVQTLVARAVIYAEPAQEGGARGIGGSSVLDLPLKHYRLVQERIAPLMNVADIQLNLIPIQPGTFVRGSPQEDEERWEWELPECEITMRQPYWIAQTPVTQAQYRSVCAHLPEAVSAEQRGPDHPVTEVTWEDAQKFCERLTLIACRRGGQSLPPGFVFRLPTESEWERACRGGIDHQPRYGAPADLSATLDNGRSFGPVRQAAPNPLGIHDMLGLVWEWCADCFSFHPPSETGSAPLTGPGKTDLQWTSRVLKGGSWAESSRYARSAARHTFKRTSPDYSKPTSSKIGFRIVLARPL